MLSLLQLLARNVDLPLLFLLKSQGNRTSVPVTAPEAESHKGRPLTASC